MLQIMNNEKYLFTLWLVLTCSVGQCQQNYRLMQNKVMDVIVIPECIHRHLIYAFNRLIFSGVDLTGVLFPRELILLGYFFLRADLTGVDLVMGRIVYDSCFTQNQS